MPQPVFHLKRVPRVERADVNLKAAVEILRVYILCPSISALLLKSASDKIQPGFIEVITELVGAGHPHHDWRSLRDQAQTLLTVAKSIFSLFAFDELCCKPCQYI